MRRIIDSACPVFLKFYKLQFRNLACLAFFLAGNFFFAISGYAATYTLTTAGAGNAETPGNWNTGGAGGGGTPATNFSTPGDIFIIDSGTAGTFTSGSTTTFEAGVILQVTGTFTIGAAANATTILLINGTIEFTNSSTTQVTIPAANGNNENRFELGTTGILKTNNTNGISGANCSLPATASKAIVTLSATADYEFNGTANQASLGLPATVNSLTINNTGGIGSNNVTLAVSTTVTQSLVLTAGVLNITTAILNAGDLQGSGNLRKSNIGSAVITVGSNNASTSYSGVISNGSGSIALTKTGTGTLTLSGDNSYTGETTISGGTIKLGSSGTSPNGPLGTTGSGTTVSTGAALDLNGFTLATTESLTLNGTGESSTGALTNSSPGAVSYFGSIVLMSATSVGGTGDIALIGFISGGFSFTKSGNNTLTLSGTNTYSGITHITSGTVKLGASSSSAALGPLGNNTGGTIVYAGAVLDLNGFSLTAGATEGLTLNGTGISNSGALTNTSVTASSFHGVPLLGSSSSIIASAGDINITNTSPIGGSFPLILGGTANGSITSIIAIGSGTITKEGSGTWSLTGNNTYTGKTTINNGTLSIASIRFIGGIPNSLGQPAAGPNSIIDLGGTATLKYMGTGHASNRVINLTGSGATIDASGSGEFAMSGGVAGNTYNLVFTGSGSQTQSGAIETTTGNVIKNGIGTLTLSGTNSFSGGVTLNSGTLNIGNSSALGTSAGTFTINGGTVGNIQPSVTTNNHPQQWNADFAFSGPNPLNLGTGLVTMSASRQITCIGSTLTVGGTIDHNNFNLTKAGAGILSLAGNDKTINSLTITEGTLLSTAGLLNLAGDFINNDTFTHNSGTVVFNGTTQAISGSSSTEFNVLTINSGSTVTGTTEPVASVFNIHAGGKYVHTAATAVVPGTSKNFAPTSTYEWQGTGAFPSTAGIAFGNLIINSTSGDNNASGRLTTVNGNLNILATAGGSYALGMGTSPVLNIAGDLQIDGGKLIFSIGTGAPTVNVTGNVVLNDGILEPMNGTGIPELSLLGNWENNGGAFTPGASLVTFNNTSADQNVHGTASTQTFGDVTIAKNTNKLTIGGSTTNVIVSGLLTMTSGNIDCGMGTLELGVSASTVGSLSYVTGNIIGNFKRWINSTGSGIQFPVGTLADNHMALATFTNLTSGSLIAKFIPSDPGSAGLPLTENSNNLNNQFTEGYWSLIAGDGLSSTDYAIELTGTNFNSYTINEDTRIIKRPSGGGDWTLDGMHVAAESPVAKRSALSGFSEFAFAEAVPCAAEIGAPAPATQTHCSNGIVTALTTTGQSGGSGMGFTYQWYSNPINSNTGGTLIPGETNLTYTPPATPGTMYYYVVVSKTGCPDVASATASVTILESVDYGTVAGGDESICEGGDPTDITLSVEPTGGAGTFNYQWYYQDGIVDCPIGTGTTGWTLINGATSNSYDPPSGLITSRTYVVQVDPTGSPDCGEPTWATSCRKVTVNETPACFIDGPVQVCPSASATYMAPAGMAEYAWILSGGGAISGSTTSQTISVDASSVCNTSFTLTLTVTDENGCTSGCLLTVDVTDTSAPTLVNVMNDCTSLDLPNQNICLNAAAAFDGASLFDEVQALYEDNCDLDIAVILFDTVHAAGNSDCNWTITYVYEIEDNCNNSVQCSVVYSGGDTEDPALINPLVDCSSLNSSEQNVCLSTAGSFDGATLEIEVAALYEDNCDMAVTATLIDTVHAAGNSDCNWSITYVYEIEDNCNNSVQCNVVYSGGDTESPELVNPLIGCSSLDQNNLNICADEFDGTSLEDDVAALYTDNCDASVNATLTATTSAIGNSDCSWSHVYVYTITDECGNASTCNVNISGGDTEAPMLINPLVDCSSLDSSDQNICLGEASLFDGATLAEEVAALFDDNCDQTVTAALTDTVHAAGNNDCSWMITYLYEIVDNCNNSVQCNVVYSGGDTEVPTLINPIVDCSTLNSTGNTVCLSTASLFDGATLEDDVAALYDDNCDLAVTATLIDTVHAAGNSDCNWTITYVYQIKDNCNNSVQCSVEYSGGDTEAPVLNNPLIDCSSLDFPEQNICLSTASSFDGVTLEDEVAALYHDNCDLAVTAILIDTVHAAGNSDCNWTITYKYKIEDNCNNSVQCNVVYSGGDAEAPVLISPMVDCSTLNSTGNAVCLSTASMFEGSTLEDNVAGLYDDNCDQTVTAVLIDTVHAAGNSDCNWTITYLFEVADNCNNSVQCNVVYSGGDTEDPQLINSAVDCSSLDLPNQNICLSTASDFDGSTLAEEVAGLYNDNCDQAVTATLTDTIHAAGNSDCSWTITYIFEVADNCNNSVECHVVYSGADTEGPALIAPVVDCSSLDFSEQNICLSTASSFDGTTLEDEVAGLYGDNCDLAVTATLIDTLHAAGNNDCNWMITYVYEIEDNCNNSVQCNVVYSGGDIEDPELISPMVDCSTLDLSQQNICLSSASSFDGSMLEGEVAALYHDNCDLAVTAILIDTVHSAGNTDCNWTITYIYEIEDNCNNSVQCNVVYSGGDTEDPELISPMVDCSTLDSTGNNVCLSIASLFDGATLEDEVAALYDDNCDQTVTAALIDTVHTPGNSDCNWMITYVYEVVDNCNNSVQCNVVYSGGDTEAPMLINPMVDCSTLNSTENNVCLSAASLFDGTMLEDDVAALYDDNCDQIVTTVLIDTIHAAGNSDCSWMITYVYEVVDNCNNSVQCDVVYSGGDSEDPALINPLVDCSSLDFLDQNICLSTASSFDGSTLKDEVAALYNDNCDMAVTAILIDTVHAAGNSDCNWTITYLYEVEDNCNNNVQCSVVYSGGDIDAPELANSLIGCSSLDQNDLNMCAGNFDGTSLEDDVAALYTDNCNGSVNATLTSTTSGIDNSDCSWSYMFTYTIMDACGNASTCSVNISGGDTEDPMLINPLVDCSSLDSSSQNICLSTASLFDGAIIADEVGALYDDNCDLAVTASLIDTIHAAGNNDCNWMITYVYEIEDNCNNSVQCNVVYSGGDTEVPALINPMVDCSTLDSTENNVCLSAASLFDGTTLEDEVAALYGDNCDLAVTATLIDTVHAAGNTDCNWLITYVYEIEDNCSNSVQCSVAYSGGDTEDPVLINPDMDCSSLDFSEQNICLSVASNFDGATLEDEVAALYDDNCDLNVTSTLIDTLHAAGNSDCNWTITYVYEIEDNCGNSVQCSVVYSGGDTENPALINSMTDCSTLDSTGNNVCLSTASMFDGATLVDDVATLYSDNCDMAVTATLIDTVHAAGNSDCNWTISYMYEIEDNCGNNVECSVVYSGGDTEVPALINSIIDCSTLDSMGNNVCLSTASLFDGVTLEDEVAALYGDNCDQTVTATLIDTVHAQGNSDCNWTITYMYEIEDNCSNSVQCNVVYSGGDTEAPMLISPMVDCSTLNSTENNVCLSTASLFDGTTLEGDVAALYVDNCDQTVTAVLIDTVHAAGNNDCSWMITYLYEIVDNCNNSVQCNVVYSGGDTEDPELINPLVDCSSLNSSEQNICLNTASSFDGATLEDEVAALYSDNCDMTVTATLIDTVHAAGNSDCGWTIAYVYEIEDNCNNSVQCSVMYSGGDADAPELVNPLIECNSLDQNNLNMCADDFDGTSLEDEVAALYSDNCNGSVNATLTATTSGIDNSDCNWSYVYTYTITDECGNASTCSVNISGGDTGDPMLINPLVDCSSLDSSDQNICLSTASLFDGTTIAVEVAALYTDNCDQAVTATVIDTIHTAGNSDCSWTITYVYEIGDDCNNSVQCNVVYSGGDTEVPELINPLVNSSSLNFSEQNICLSTASLFDGAILEDDVAALYNDNCDPAVTATLIDTVHAAGNSDCNWIITYVYEIEDECSNSVQCNVVYSGGDTEVPVLINPVVDCSTLDSMGYNACLSIASSFDGTSLEDEVAALYTDNCDQTVTATLINTVHTPGNSDCIWTITYVYEIEDNCNNSVQCSVAYSGGDTEDPVLINSEVDCSSLDISEQNICLNTASLFDGTSLEDEVAALYSDNCDLAVMATLIDTVHSPGNSDCNWTITYIYEIGDDCLNGTLCSVVYSGGDIENPSFTVPDDITIYSDMDCNYNATTAVTGDVMDESDNCSTGLNATFIDNIIPGCEGSQTITRTWTVTDDCGLVTTHEQIITVSDTLAPTFTAPSDITIYSDADCIYNTDTTFTGDVTDEYDNCSELIEAIYTDSIPVMGLCEGSWTIKRKWSLEDGCGNSTTHLQIITVMDTIVPSFTRPPDITIFSDAACAYNASVAVTGDATNLADNCTTSLLTTFEDEIVPGPCDGSQVVLRTWMLIDDCGNAAPDQVQTITVSDTISPEFTVPPDVTIYSGVDCSYDASVAGTGDVTDESDNCAIDIEATFADDIFNTCDGSKVITRTWSLSDGCGNTTTYEQLITVTDTTSPTFTVPVDVTIFVDASCLYNSDPLITGDVTDEGDNCSVAINATYEDSVVAGPCEGSWLVTRTWNLIDDCDNQTEKVQMITVSDTISPSFTRPGDITIVTDSLCGYDAGVQFTGDVTNESDNCSSGIQATFIDVIVAGECDGSFVITRTWSLVDACGNNASDQIQLITVTDNLPPYFTEPDDVTIYKDDACGYSALVIVTGDVTDEIDNCDTSLQASFNDSVAPGSCNGEEIISRLWSLTDDCGNVTMHLQVITVLDTISPLVSSPVDSSIECSTALPEAANTIDAFILLTGASATDNCSDQDDLQVSSIDGPFAGTECSGTITRTYTITDMCGNTTSIDHVFNISDDTAPIVSAGPIEECYETISLAEAAALAATMVTDNCSDTFSYAVNTAEGMACDSVITVTVTDECGNTNAVEYETRINCQVVRLKVFLEGPYDIAGDSMKTTLNMNHLLPGQNTTLPFIGDTPSGQPYNTPPYNYNDNLGMQYGDPPYGTVPYPADVVDWVLVSVREEGILPANTIWTCTGWIHEDGIVTFPDSCPVPAININNEYYIVVQHRNHLGIMSPFFVDIECDGAFLNWDFTTSDSYKPPFRTGQKLIDGIWAMLTANSEQINTIKVISSPDLTLWSQQQGMTGYRKADHNMNISVNSADETMWKSNQNKTSGVTFY